MRRLVLVLVVALGAGPAVAEDLAKQKRTCGCAPQRLLDGGQGAWLDDDETAARIVAVPLSYFEAKTSLDAASALPTEDVDLAGGSETGRHRLVRVDTTALGPDDRVALLRAQEAFPKDVQVTGPRPGELSLDSLWLGPRVKRERAGCGTYESHAVLFDAGEQSPPVDALIVEQGGRRAVVDVRHARTFGLGRVDVCGHGLALAPGDGPVSITAVHLASGSRVGPLTFAVHGGQVPVPQFDTEGDNPFIHGLGDAPGLGHDEDEAALTTMLGVGGGAFAFAFFLWPLLRRRRRDEQLVTCPVCQAETMLDVLDDKTDGMFCPQCGKSSVFIQVQADGARLPMVIALDEEADGAPTV